MLKVGGPRFDSWPLTFLFARGNICLLGRSLVKPIFAQIGDHQKDTLESYAAQTGYTQAELLRRILDHTLPPAAMNAVVPAMSGRFVPPR